MANDILRMNYFNELKLYQDEFRLEQDYHIRMRRLHNAHLHTWGIVWGLDVDKKDPENPNEYFIRITEGMALDKVSDPKVCDPASNEFLSHEIMLTNDTGIDLQKVVDKIFPSIPAPLPLNIDLFVYAIYLKEDAKEASGDPQKVGGIDKYKYSKETAKIEVSNTKPVEENDEHRYIMLAKVDYDIVAKKINKILSDKTDPTQRSQDAGAFTGSIETKTLKLNVDSPVQAKPLATINGSILKLASGTTVNGIKVMSQKTEFTGPLEIQGDVEISGNLKLSAKSTVEGITPAKIDPDGSLTVARINASSSIINKKNIPIDVGGSGWVKLPFLPKKFNRDVLNVSNYPDFVKLEGYSVSYISTTIGTPSGAYGIMEIPIPPHATKIIEIQIGGKNAGKDISDNILVSLYRNRYIPNTPVSINNFQSTKLMEQYPFTGAPFYEDLSIVPADATLQTIGIPADLDPKYDTLALKVTAKKTSEIWFFAARFE